VQLPPNPLVETFYASPVVESVSFPLTRLDSTRLHLLRENSFGAGKVPLHPSPFSSRVLAQKRGEWIGHARTDARAHPKRAGPREHNAVVHVSLLLREKNVSYRRGRLRLRPLPAPRRRTPTAALRPGGAARRRRERARTLAQARP